MKIITQILSFIDSEVELICSTGGRAPVDKANCGVVDIPPKMVNILKEIHIQYINNLTKIH